MRTPLSQALALFSIFLLQAFTLVAASKDDFQADMLVIMLKPDDLLKVGTNFHHIFYNAKGKRIKRSQLETQYEALKRQFNPQKIDIKFPHYKDYLKQTLKHSLAFSRPSKDTPKKYQEVPLFFINQAYQGIKAEFDSAEKATYKKTKVVIRFSSYPMGLRTLEEKQKLELKILGESTSIPFLGLPPRGIELVLYLENYSFERLLNKLKTEALISLVKSDEDNSEEQIYYSYKYSQERLLDLRDFCLQKDRDLSVLDITIGKRRPILRFPSPEARKRANRKHKFFR